MIAARIEGATRVLGKCQGYTGLPIKDTKLNWNGTEYPVMISCWEPTPDEAKRIAEGGKIYLAIMGTVHPPVIMSASEIEK